MKKILYVYRRKVTEIKQSKRSQIIDTFGNYAKEFELCARRFLSRGMDQLCVFREKKSLMFRMNWLGENLTQ